MRLGSATRGQATPDEAADMGVFQSLALAALQIDRALAAELRQQAETDLADGFVRRWVLAMLGMTGPDGAPQAPNELIALWNDALAVAATDDERRQALQGLAFVGSVDLPGIDQLVEPALAAEWRARSALARGDAAAAVTILHPYRLASPPAASALAEAYEALGRIDPAVTTLLDAAERFDHDRLLVQAALTCVRAGDATRGEQILADALRAAATTWAGRAEALDMLGELQARRGSWIEATTSWQSSLEADPHSDGTRWQLAGSLERRGEHQPAWAVLTADPDRPGRSRRPPTPETPAAAELLLVLTARFEDPQTAIEVGLELIDQFPEEEDLAGPILSTLLTLGATDRGPLEGSSGTAPAGALSSVPAVSSEVDPAVLDRLYGTVDAFLTAHPENRRFQRRTGSPEALAEQMTELARPDPGTAALLQQWLTAVTRGEMPLGNLAAATNRRHADAVVTHVAGVLSTVGDPVEHRSCVANAFNLLGVRPISPTPPAPGDPGVTVRPALLSVALVPVEEAVVDASTLYVLSTIPHLAPLLIGSLRSLVLVDQGYTDILATRDGLALDSPGSWVVDADTGKGGFVATDPAVTHHRRAAIAAVVELAASCRRVPAPSTSHPMLDAAPSAEQPPWVAGLRVAAARRAVVWCDDVAVRRVARQLGLAAISTPALIDTLVELGRLSSDDREQAVRNLIVGGVGDFAPDARRFAALVGADTDSRAAALSAMAKPGFWADIAEALTVWDAALAQTRGVSAETVPHLAHSALLGAARSLMTDTSLHEVSCRLLATAMHEIGPGGDIPTLLAAIRAALAAAGRSLPDPLEEAARRVLAGLEAALGPAMAADTLRALVAQCSNIDESTINEIVLLHR